MTAPNHQLGITLAWLALAIVCLAVVGYGIVSGIRPGEKHLGAPTNFEDLRIGVWLVCLIVGPLAGFFSLSSFAKWARASTCPLRPYWPYERTPSNRSTWRFLPRPRLWSHSCSFLLSGLPSAKGSASREFALVRRWIAFPCQIRGRATTRGADLQCNRPASERPGYRRGDGSRRVPATLDDSLPELKRVQLPAFQVDL